MSDGNVSDQVAQRTGLLKAVVIGLGVLLAICAAIVIGTIVYRLFNLPEPKAANFGVSPLPLPAGCTVDYVQAEGDRLILHIGGADTCSRVLVADLKTGALIGQFQFPTE